MTALQTAFCFLS